MPFNLFNWPVVVWQNSCMPLAEPLGCTEPRLKNMGVVSCKVWGHTGWIHQVLIR